MRKELKRVNSVAAGLVIALITFSSLAADAGAVSARASQSSASYSPEQEVVARVSLTSRKDVKSLVASGVSVLEGSTDQDVYIRTTFARIEQLQREGRTVVMLFVRDTGADAKWISVQGPLGDGCSYVFEPTFNAVTSVGGTFNVTLGTSDPSCEWTILSGASWLHLNGQTQGVGSTVISYTVDPNPGSTNRIGNLFTADQVFTLYQGVQFNDVPQDHLFYLEIEKLSAHGITVGCGNGNFCPNDIVPREQMAAFILRARGEFNPPTPASQRFNDVPPANVFYNFIDRIAELEITVGCTPDHMFYCPSDPVKRDQMSAFILRGLGEFNPPTPATQRFADVPPSNPFYNFIDRLAVLGITQGCGGGNYCPNLPTTRGQMAAFLVRAFNL